MNYALWFLLGFFTCSFAGRVMAWHARRAVTGDSELSRRLRKEFIGKMDHDRLLMWRDAIGSELERRKTS